MEMHELFIDPFASHVYQAIIHTLTGHPRKNLGGGNVTKKRKKKHTEDTTYQIPESYTNTLAKILKTVKEWDIELLQSLVFDKYAVPLMQIITESDVVKKPKKKSKDKKGVSSATLSDIILFGNDADSEGTYLIFNDVDYQDNKSSSIGCSRIKLEVEYWKRLSEQRPTRPFSYCSPSTSKNIYTISL